MKTEIKAGAVIETLTLDELQDWFNEQISGYFRGPQTMRPDGGNKTNGSGNVDVHVYRVPAGMVFSLHRAFITADGYTFASPFTANAGYVEIHRNGEAVDGIPLGNGAFGIPIAYTAGDSDAIDFRNGERVTFHVVGGPASTAIVVRCQGTLAPIAAF